MRLFKPRFAALVEAGSKTQTVRPTPKRMPQPGDTISLRCWTGAPYRSKQRVLREAVVREVHRLRITAAGQVIVDDCWLAPESSERFARMDGFRDLAEMREWFRETHELPFEGVLLSWHNNAEISHDRKNGE